MTGNVRMSGWVDGGRAEGISRIAGTGPAGRRDGCAPKSVSGAGGIAKLSECARGAYAAGDSPRMMARSHCLHESKISRDPACPLPKRTHAQIDAPDDSRSGGAQTRSSILEARSPQATSVADGVLDIVS